MEMLNNGRHGFRKLTSFTCFRNFLHYSTSINTVNPSPTHKITQFMVDYLKNSLGFSFDEAITASTNLTHLKSTENLDLVLNFFKEIGLENSHIRKVISSRPRLLSYNVEKTLKPKIRVFQEHGLCGSTLINLISKDPCCLTRGLNTHIIPSILFLQTVTGSKENLIKAIKKSPWLISFNTQKLMQPNILLLQKCGVSDMRIKKSIVENPRRFLVNTNRFEEIVDKVIGDFGILGDSWMFIYAINSIVSLSNSTLETKFKIFESFGWSKSDVLTMTRNLPYCMSLSESKIRRGLNFLMNDLGFDPSYIASHPKFLMFSLEKRVAPRNAVLRALKEKYLINKRNLGLYSIVCLSESQFLKEFLLQYKDVAPDVYEDYIRSVKTATKDKLPN